MEELMELIAKLADDIGITPAEFCRWLLEAEDEKRKDKAPWEE